MKISCHWMADLIALDEPPDRLAADLSMLGLPVDAMERLSHDTLIDIDVTANRPDCLSHLGIARELSALYHEPLRRRAPAALDAGRDAAPAPAITIEDPDLCARFCGVRITGVRVAPSPCWLQERLLAVGQRPINNLVDITNYILLELGHPLHAYDFSKLTGGCLVARRARPGETVQTLDGRIRALAPDMLVIADAARAVGIAGVMGGAESEVADTTTDVLLESAWFQPASVRRTARALEMRTEASYRFERGADLEMPPRALWRAARLILELAGGEAVSPVVDVYPRPWAPPEIALRRERVERLVGVPVAGLPVEAMLRRLGFQVEAAPDGWRVRPPAHRVDVGLEVDLIEEVARLHGYDRIPSTLPLHPSRPVSRQFAGEKAAVRQFLKECGLQEILTPNFTDVQRDAALLWAPAGEPVRVDNPLDEGEPFLRQGLLPAMVAALKLNENNYNPDVRLFEVASVYDRCGDGHVEPVRLAIGAYGQWLPAHWSAAGIPADFARIKGVVEGLVDRLNVPAVVFDEADDAPFLQPGAAAWIRLGGGIIGYIGQLNELLAQKLKFRRKVFVAELLFEPLAAGIDRSFAFRALPRFPFVDRDMSFVVDIGVSFSTIKTSVIELKMPELAEVKLVDLYRGDDIPPDRKAMNVRLVFQHPERTLTDEEADRLRERAAASLRKRFQAQFR